ncbi:mitochondrial 2-oxodicarboxylate carrier isoform X3 [Delphinus delphis]|nr:mitochondrial 2-oxodicarboxylate carrier isoform X3 [Delphinus delphis]
MIFRTEGLFGFYKGILPPILAETPKRAVKFFTFEQYKKLLGYVSLSPALTFAIAGLGSGLTEAIVVNPFEVVKVGLQANRNKFTEQPSTMSYARHIIKKEGLGLQGLNKGFTATLGRHGVFNMVYFGFYYNVKNIIPVNKDPTLEFLRKFGVGLLSGTIASVINIPFDVAKSRIQGPQPVPGEIKYRTCFKTMATVYQEEGILALYKGLLPKIMRLGPEHSLQTRRLSGHGSRAQLLRGMWDLPGPWHEPASPASAGRLSTTAPPGKPPSYFYNSLSSSMCLMIRTSHERRILKSVV